MDTLTHLNTSRNLAALAEELSSRGQCVAAGESVWGAVVHAVSAADPDHEVQPQDRFRNFHQAPNTMVTFSNAVRRIGVMSLSATQINICLSNGQQKLHNHFYHLNLTPQELRFRVRLGAAYAQLFMNVAAGELGQSEP